MRTSVHELAGGGASTWQSTEHDGGASCAYGEGEGAGEVGEEGRADALADGRVVARLVVQDARASTDHLYMYAAQPASTCGLSSIWACDVAWAWACVRTARRTSVREEESASSRRDADVFCRSATLICSPTHRMSASQSMSPIPALKPNEVIEWAAGLDIQKAW